MTANTAMKSNYTNSLKTNIKITKPSGTQDCK